LFSKRVLRSGQVRRDSALESNGPAASGWEEQDNTFPERKEITNGPFFDAPFKLLSRVHRGFLRLAVFASLFVFAFWGVVYALDLTSEQVNPPSQVALMRSNLLFGGSPDRLETDEPDRLAGAGLSYSRNTTGRSREALLANRVRELEQAREEDGYQSEKRFKEQYKIIASQRSELNAIKSATGQLEQTLPGQLSDIGSRVGAAEARAR